MAQRLAGRLSDKPMATPNMAPLIGVLLAVFTVVTATSVGLDKAVNLHVDVCSLMPPGAQVPSRVYLSFQQNGEVYLGATREPSHAEAVADAIREARIHGLAGVSLRADAEVRYETVAAVVRALDDAGLKANFLNEEIH
ncbi:ExbD/TolR family protein [Caulobacter hibisci]|uniref:Biopolymer transporter ExbD n=1 Tax=Caulobacter hibisci TaxID=2035993 RepID=A0ABS0T2L6_9CAUL|nr:biopolymer transporter ExbD [Caulobacter hibisci]MBI1685726.1 biopolymer transporter ExbD [Caulobacter hibisci]